jgi:sodium/pantothenate symporter
MGTPAALMTQAASVAPELGAVANRPWSSYVGSFVLWAAAIPVIPHIVMRVFTAKDARGARLSLNIAMMIYSVMILSAVLAIVPVGKIHFPNLQDPDQVFLKVMEQEFSPVVRGLAVAAVLAAVMSTTDALLLACSSAVAHDLLGNLIRNRFNEKIGNWVSVGVAWVIGLIAMFLAYSPPKLITEFYSAAIGMLSAGLFVPVIAGLWWKRANVSGGVAALLVGTVVYLGVQYTPGTPPLSAILFALPASVLAMWLFGYWGGPPQKEILETISRLHT